MKILYVKDEPSAIEFNKENKKNIVFAKYFSPTCPACKVMESEWDELCKDIDEKYNTDLILAQIDPQGMEHLGNMNTYSDVEYVPAIIILKNGKKIEEYNGPKNKSDMLNFLLEKGHLKQKMIGGTKRRVRKSKKVKHLNKHRRTQKGKGIGQSKPVKQTEYEEEFNFVENKNWLQPFLIALLDSPLYDDKVVTEDEAVNFAIRSVDSIFRPKGIRRALFNEYRQDWILCPQTGMSSESGTCRKSPGFGNRDVPNVRKFNPIYEERKYKNKVRMAENSYNYLKNKNKINTILKTPSSDYTRYNLNDEQNKLEREYLQKLRENLSAQKETNNFEAILQTYGYKRTPSMDELKETVKETKNIMDQTLDEIFNKSLENEDSKINTKGGKRKTRKSKKSKKIKQKGGGPVYSKKSKLSDAIIAEKPQKAWTYDNLTRQYFPAVGNAGVATPATHLPLAVRVTDDGTPQAGGKKRKTRKTRK